MEYILEFTFYKVKASVDAVICPQLLVEEF